MDNRKTIEELQNVITSTNVMLKIYNTGGPVTPSAAQYYSDKALGAQKNLYENHKIITEVRTPVRLENKIKK